VAKWVILALSIALLIPAFVLAGKLGDVQRNDNSAFLPSNAEATKPRSSSPP
jgi:putative drug exporter of the RND superfamily